MRYAEHARFLADNYRDLQGLRFVPLGVFFLIGAVWDASPREWQTTSTGVPMLGLFVAGIVLYFVIGAYYKRVHGHVEPSARRTRANKRVSGLWFAFLGVAFGLLVVNVATGYAYAWLFIPSGILLVVTLYYHGKLAVLSEGSRPGTPEGPRQVPLALVFVLLLLFTGQIPALSSQDCGAELLNTCVAQDLLIGGILMGGGLYNHRLLRRGMSAVREDVRDRAV